MTQNVWATLLLSASVIAAMAQQPQVSNGSFISKSVDAGLSAAVDRFQHSNEPQWVGYEVPALPQASVSLCSGGAKFGNGCCGEYSLEGNINDISTYGKTETSSANLYVLLRFDHGSIIKARSMLAGCHLNAGGIPFTWLTGVKPEESVAFLGRLAENSTGGNSYHLTDEALASLAMHGTPAATRTLGEFTSPNHVFKLREQAAFWLGVERGHDGFVILQQLAQSDADSTFREKLTFDLSQNAEAGAVNELMRMAKSDESAKVRGQAMFWLAQKAGKKAASTLSDAAENDPELSVKKKVVFALSQLPQDESIPQLIHVAETNSNPFLRKEAIFWIGQSKDPKALQYLEELLKR